MRILQLSDLHLEFQRPGWAEFIRELDPMCADVVALCGDICAGRMLHDVLTEFGKHFVHSEVLFVPGNHEYYGCSFADIAAQLRDLPDNVHDLDAAQVITIDDQRFLGRTLWYPLLPEVDRVLRRSVDDDARYSDPGYTWSDFEHINGPHDIFTAATAATAHLQVNLQPGDVVLTHMLPSYECVSPRWRVQGAETNQFFVHDHHDLILERKPALWMFGHTHDSVDVTIGDTRLRSNPRGYYPYDLNRDFAPDLVHTL